MLRPKAQLKKLIARASPQQAASALAMTRRHVAACRKLDIPEIPIERILEEALQIALVEASPDDEAVMRARHDFYMSRTYSRTYSEQ
jgi:hypothetical protein